MYTYLIIIENLKTTSGEKSFEKTCPFCPFCPDSYEIGAISGSLWDNFLPLKCPYLHPDTDFRFRTFIYRI